MVYTPFVWLLLFASLMNGGVAYYAKRYRDVPSVGPFRFMMWNAALWASCYALSVSSVYFPFKLFTLNLVYVPAQLAAVASLALALEYTGRKNWLTTRKLGWMISPALLFTLLAFTSRSHQLWRYDHQLIWSSSVPVIVAAKGLFYWAYIAYMLSLSVGACAILLASLQFEKRRLRGTLALAAGIFIPVVTGSLYVFELTPLRGFDWTSASFIGTGFLYIWAVAREKMFASIPLARSILVEYMEAPMVILDDRGRISDFNRAARSVLALSPAAIGSSPSSLGQPWGGIFQSRAETAFGSGEVLAGDRVYELNITPIQASPSVLSGRIFLFLDITERKRAEEREHQQRILAEALRDASQALTSTLDANEVFERILENVRRVVPTDSANIALLDGEGVLNYIHFYGYENHAVSMEELRQVRFSISTSRIFQRVFLTGEPLIVPDTRAYPDWIVTRSGDWIRSYAIMPIRAREAVIGFLSLDSAIPNLYTPEHLQNLRAFADQAAVAVENARLFDALSAEARERKSAGETARRQNGQLNALHQITFDLLKRRNLDDLLNAILSRACKLLDSPYGLLGLLEEDILFVRSAADLNRSQLGMRIRLADAKLSALAVKTREPQSVGDYSSYADRMEIHESFHLKAVLTCPIIIGSRVAGVVSIARSLPGAPYTEEEVEVMKSLGQFAALAIDNAQLFAAAQNELLGKVQAEEELRNANQKLMLQLEAIEVLQTELREQAIRDPLTGLYNRRYLTEALERELSRAGRGGYLVGFVMIDIDRFKIVNDTFGHNAGDIVLQKLAAMLLGQTRIGDIVCRYGGEEFLVVIPNTSAEKTLQIAERWRLSFMGATLPFALENHQLTISCGISLYPAHSADGSILIDFADKALYLAKASGRNCVMFWDQPNILAM